MLTNGVLIHNMVNINEKGYLLREIVLVTLYLLPHQSVSINIFSTRHHFNNLHSAKPFQTNVIHQCGQIQNGVYLKEPTA